MAILSNEDPQKVVDCWRAECRARAAADAALSPSTADYNRDDVADAIRGIARTLDYHRSAAENITKGRLYALADKTRAGNVDVEPGSVDHGEPDEVDLALDEAQVPTIDKSGSVLAAMTAVERIRWLAGRVQSLERALERERDAFRDLAMVKAAR
jgi:hypothetical protein